MNVIGNYKYMSHSYKTDFLRIRLFAISLLILILLPGQKLFAVEASKSANLTINLIDGVNNDAPMTDTRINIHEILDDGSLKWRKRVDTDGSGQASLYLDGLGSGKIFRLSARSSYKNHLKKLQISTTGSHTFRVGTPLLNIILRDAKTEQTIPNIRVTAYQIRQGEKDKWLTRATSNDDGKLTLDIPVLSDGGVIRLKADKVYNNLNAFSPVIKSAGNIDFLVGDIHIKVLDTRNDNPIPNQSVFIYTRENGKNKWYGKAATDDKGLLRLSLKGVNKDSDNPPDYILKTRSPFNNKYKFSQLINQVGDYDYMVGEPLLNVTLKDASNNDTPIANTEIKAYELVDGKRQYRGKATTNAAGLAEFDIPALSQGGATVQLRTKVFNSNFWAYSQDISSAGNVDFKLATTTVNVKDGSVPKGTAFANLKVNLREVISSDKSKSIANLETDAQGILRLTLPSLDKGKSYILRAKHPSPVISKQKYSPQISSSGQHEFVVGTKLLKITLKDAYKQTAIANKRIDVYKDNGTEKAKWLGKLITNTQGYGEVDIPLLSESANTFYLRAKQPYDAGNVYSTTFTSGTYIVDFPAGKTPVTLTDKDTSKPFTNQRIDALEVLDSGKLKWRARGNTNSNGTVHFDLSQLAAGKRHVFRTKNLYGNNKRYYSELVFTERPVSFEVSASETSPLDLKAPVVAISSPSTGSDVAVSGFVIQGTATDNEQVVSINIELTEGSNSSTHTATYDSNSGLWQATIAPEYLTSGSNIQITATATDASQIKHSVSSNYTVISDATPPTLSISSHANNDDVVVTGFLLQGSATDDTGVASVHAIIQDSNSVTLVDRDIDQSSTGNFAIAINNGVLSSNSTVTITLTATDIAGRKTSETLNLNVVPANNEARHMLNRITFGATPELLNEINSNGVSAFLNTQLSPETIDDSALESILINTGDPSSKKELQVYQLTHIIYSKRQLKEVMAWFWENHFNTDIDKPGNLLAYELAEHKAFRENALGNFRELLEISAKSPAMLVYLDSILNINTDANENYAREVMELSTCGVDACYTQDDVESLAEILTGWQIRNGAFFFNESAHTSGSKVFQGVVIPESGVEEGNTALDMLASHRATANYICSKLIQVFVSDIANPGLNSRCANTFQNTANDHDQIAQVLRMLLTSPEFNSATNFNGKIKSPVEFATGVARAFQAQGNHEDLPTYIRRMGIELFRNPVPTGWDEVGSTWINSALLQERTRFVNKIARASSNSSTYIDPVNFFKSLNLETAEGIVSYLLNLTGGNIWSELERQTAMDILSENGDFDINAATAKQQLQELIGTVLSFPEYNYQ